MKWCYLIGLVVVVFLMVLFSACGRESIDFENKELERNGPMFPPSLKTREYYVFKSAAQIEEFANLLEVEWNKEQPEWTWDLYVYDRIKPIVQKYNDTFFSSSILVMIQNHDIIPRYKIKKMYVRNKELFVKLKSMTRYTSIAPGVMSDHSSLLIPLKTSDFNGDIVHVQY